MRRTALGTGKRPTVTVSRPAVGASAAWPSRAGAALYAVLGCLLMLQSCSDASIEPESVPTANRDLARGAALYAGSCGQFCHGSAPAIAPTITPAQTALADPGAMLSVQATTERVQHARAQDAPDLFDCAWLTTQTDGEIAAVIVAGIQGTRMVGFGENFPEGPRDHARLIAYLRATAACEAELPAGA